MGKAERDNVQGEQVHDRRRGSVYTCRGGLSVASKECMGRRAVQYPEHEGGHACQARGEIQGDTQDR